MKTIKDVRELIQKADDLQSSITTSYVTYREELFLKIKAIQGDRDLSAEGRSKKTELLKRKERAILMKEAKQLREEYNGYLAKARTISEDIYFAHSSAVDAVKQERFTKQLTQLKTEVMLSNSRQGEEKIKGFLEKIDEPIFFEQTSAIFAELASPILNNAKPGEEVEQYRRQLSDMFDTAKKSAMHPDALEAERLIQYVNAAANGRLFPIPVENAIEMDLGKEAKIYLNKPEEYFAAFPDDEALVPVKGLNTEKYVLARDKIK